MTRITAYRLLCALVGAGFVVGGLALFLSFFAYHAPDSDPFLATGPLGFYFVGFAGTALFAWGGCLLSAARRPMAGRAIGTWSALALVLCALMRMAAWIVGDYHVFPGEILRVEAVTFLLLALALVWLRPPAAEAAA